MEKRKILIFVDGSHQSLETVNYVSSVVEPHGTEIVLLHIMSRIPEQFWDLEKEPGWQHKVQTVRTWESRMREGMECFMEKACQMFIEEGFPRDSVRTEIRDRQEGVARDLTNLANNNGYDSVIIGRRGFSKIKDLSIGSTASKVASRAAHFAMTLVGGRPDPNGLIVGVDSSEGAMRAVDHAAKMFSNPEKKILLLHVIRSSEGLDGNPGSHQEIRGKRVDLALEKIEPVLRNATDRLLSRGFSPENICSRVITGASTRAGSIIEQAKSGGYGTILVGRRGLSSVDEFSMGRVSTKIVQAAKDRAVCVVG